MDVTNVEKLIFARSPEAVIDLGAQVIGWARELAGDHVRHNPYFIDFPRNVPDTMEFLLDCIRDAMAGRPLGEVSPGSVVDLLSLPKYGRYQHAYEEMLARHDELIPVLSDRITVLHRGGPVTEEASALYRELAGRRRPDPERPGASGRHANRRAADRRRTVGW